MKKIVWKNIFEGISLAAIVASLILVAMELRQNTAVAAADALFQLSAALDNSYRARAQDPALAQLVRSGHDDIESLTELKRDQFAAWLRADMNHLEAIWFYHDPALLADDTFDGLESICSHIVTNGGRRYWESEAKYFASGFREYGKDWCSQ